MTAKLRVELLDAMPGKPWAIVRDCEDGITDIIEEFSSKAEAKKALRQMNDEDAAIRESERRYQAQYDYACGYTD